MTEDKQDSEDLAIPDAPLPVSVLTGFLGSGKTTVLRHLLGHPAMSETAVIINEFGEIGLDHLLVEKVDDDTVLLNSGCLCCTIRGDLVDSLRDLFKRRVRRQVPPFERVVIETTGLADPAPILQTLMTDPLLSSRFRLDGVITVVDSVNGLESLDRHPESIKQAAVADRLLMSKGDLADAAQSARLAARLRTLNPAAPTHQVTDGAIEPELLFDAGLYNPRTRSLEVQAWLKEEAFAQAARHHADDDHAHSHHDHGHGHDVNRHGDDVHAFCLVYDRPLIWDRFNSWIEMLITLYGSNILRIKGLLNIAEIEEPLVIHGVQHVFHPPVRLEAWPDADRRSRLVFITRGLEQEMFDHTLRAFNEEGSAPLPDPLG